MTGMLASVDNLAEARIALDGGADIIDLKSPSAGALGALPPAVVRSIVDELSGRRPISATVGDLPMEPILVLDAARRMAATGVDYVKVGFFAGGDWSATIAALSPLAREGVRLIAVLFADQRQPEGIVGRLAEAGFTGAMLDTADKARGSLTAVRASGFLAEFVAETRCHGLICGLAGSLRQSDVAGLLALRPDYLGFRGALCRESRRTAALDADAFAAIRRAIPVGIPSPVC